MNPDPLYLIEDKMRKSTETLGKGDNSLNIVTIAQALKSTINTWDIMKLKSFSKDRDLSLIHI